MELSLEDITAAFGWQLTLAAFFFLMTNFALGLMSREKKDTLALWLMGAGTEDNWSRSFLDLFDALFGERHLSARCLIRSCIASGVSVSLIWGLMIWSGTLDRVAFGSLGFANALMIGVAVNFIADYVSLLETRYLLGRVPKLKRVSAQALVLLIDLVITGAIILLAIWLVQRSGLFVVERADVLSVGLAFSIYSAPFYSTFLTSVWTWVYILSTWVIRGFARLRLADWIDVEHRPTLIVSLILSGFVLLGSLGVGAALEEDDSGLSRLDMAVCSVAKGTICDRMRTLTNDPETQFLLQVYACEGGLTEDCVDEGTAAYRLGGERAAQLLMASCEGGDMRGCSFLGLVYNEGVGVEVDQDLAFKSYLKACDGGEPISCANIALQFKRGDFGEVDFGAALAYYERPCEEGFSGGCTALGADLEQGELPGGDDIRIRALYEKACDGEDMRGCHNLSSFVGRGRGGDFDPDRATALLERACIGGFQRSCSVYGSQLVRDGQKERGYQLLEQACEADEQHGCTLRGMYYFDGQPKDDDLGLSFLERACALDHATGCARYAGEVLRLTIEDGTLERAKDAFAAAEKACDLELPVGCFFAAAALMVHEDQTEEEIRQAHVFAERACRANVAGACDLLAEFD
ncbi:MAG: tetratricopeptide repeat protein [Pseudomonadota bacterium]